MRRLLAAAAIAAVLTATITASVDGNPTIDAATNSYRATQSLPSLPTWDVLEKIAALRAGETILNFSHPSNWQYLFDLLPSCVTGLGENLAYYTTGQIPSGWPVTAWIASPTHQANLVGTWDWQASATRQSGDLTYAVQLFAKGCPAELQITSDPARRAQPAKPAVPAPLAIPDTAMEAPQP